METSTRPEAWKTLLAFVITYVVCSSTFLAIRKVSPQSSVNPVVAMRLGTPISVVVITTTRAKKRVARA